MKILDGELYKYEVKDEIIEETDGFQILLSDDGYLYCFNYSFTVKDEEVALYLPYNSKENYPLLFLDEAENSDRVFDEEGEFTVEFLEFLKAQQ